MKFVNMKYKILENIVVMISLIILFFTGLHVVVNLNSSVANNIVHEKEINLSESINNIKLENKDLKLVYESNNVKDFYILVYLENNYYKSVLIDKEDSKILSIKDILKDWSKFLEKELALLNKKYPFFVVNTLNNSKGYKSYFLKDNEIIIYYHDYKFNDNFKEKISLRINYNEIKDILKFTPKFDKQYENEDGYSYTNKKKSVALTIDDGPSKAYNSLFLKELAKNKAHATFFMVGSMMEECNSCVLDTYRSGNEVASHTYEHMNIKFKDNKEVNNSLNKTNAIYNRITGDNIKYLRPPYGAYNKRNLENINMPIILWNLDTLDWQYRDVNHIVNYVLDNIEDGSVILIHELYETSYEAVKVLLPKLYEMGYQVVSISDLAKIKNQKLEVGQAYVSFK